MNRQVHSWHLIKSFLIPNFTRSKLVTFIASLLLVLACACGSAKPDANISPWPASTPEKQGMDSGMLLKMLDYIDANKFNVHSILIVRHGHTVLELYYPPFSKEDKHMLFSATKSFTSALVGLAIQEGKIQSVDQSILDFFSDRTIANLDDRKKNIRLIDLLNMTSGLSADDMKMGISPDWTQFTLDRNIVGKPGTYFDYNTGNTQLLSAIIQKATGKSGMTYAQEKLFTPLEIKDFYWAADPSGTTQGGIGLTLTTRDMARFGDLYLHKGKLGEKQIIPEEWVIASTKPNDNGYAYQWWQSSNGFAAGGYAGQIIYVVPDQDLITMFTCALSNNSMIGFTLTDNIIIPAIKSDQALPKSPETQKLADRIAEISNPKALPIPELPALASTINGKILMLEENPIRWESLKLDFKDNQAWITTRMLGQTNEFQFPIGLDGVWRMSPVIEKSTTPGEIVGLRNFLNPYEYGFLLGMPVDGPVAMKGEWRDDNLFRLTIQDTRDFDRDQIDLSFTSEGADITWISEIERSVVLQVKGKFE